ncbi:MAG: hypothetical protein GX456_16690 [Verrucomicrobia bacterium]|nr:hypothetical protein [Verrucomicrobiota bacterium]
MPGHEINADKLAGGQSAVLNTAAVALQKLGRMLAAAMKAQALGEPDFGKRIEEVNKLVAQIDWADIKAKVEKEVRTVLEKHQASLQARREKLHQAAKSAQVAAVMGAQSDRIGIFRVEYEGATAVVSLGGVTVTRLKEADGERLFGELQRLRAALEQTPFNRDGFFEQVKAAYGICRRAASGGDEFVPVRELHREMVLERARNSEKFRRSADPKSIEPYPLYQFVFDLARFLRGGVSNGGERIVSQTPSMRESRETIHIPNLDHPTGNETAAARLAIKPI